MKVKKHSLLLLACIVWLIAGFNILRIGLESYHQYVAILNILLSILVFLVFWFMVFLKLTRKHTHRIHMYEEEQQFFWHFFDLKSFFIMAFMMTFGILIRQFHLMPERYIAVFYTGLGAALFLAGMLFGCHYVKTIKGLKKGIEVIDMKKIMNTAIIYFAFAMIGGVFYREFTKFQYFTGATTLSVLHVHLLVLGTLLFLIIAIVTKITDLEKDKLFHIFFILYNISLPLMVIMLFVRGITQVNSTVLSSGLNGMISGIAGLSHIGIMISVFMLLFALKRNLTVQ